MMNRHTAYALLAAELEQIRRLPHEELVALVDLPSEEVRRLPGGDGEVVLRATAEWESERRSHLRVSLSATSTSWYRFEQLEEHTVLAVGSPRT